MDNPNPEKKPQEEAAGNVLKILQKEYVLSEKTKIKAWHLWLAIGVVGGLTASIFLVSNKSGRFSAGEAARGRPSTVKVISPNGGEQWQIGSTQQIVFEFQRAPRDAWYVIALTRYGSLESLISNYYTGVSPFVWKIPSFLSPGDGYQISVTMVSPKIKQGQVTDTSDSAFSLVSAVTYVRLSVPSNTLTNGDVVLYRFSATAPATPDATLTRDATLTSFPFTVSVNSATTSNFRLYAYGDSSFSVQAYATNPILQSPDTVGSGETKSLSLGATGGGDASFIIPAGTTRYFELGATVFGAVSGSSVTTQFDALGQQILGFPVPSPER